MDECNITKQLPADNALPLYPLETHVFSVLVGFITVLCTLLNALGIYAFMRLPRTPSNLVYLHLCVTDLIVGVFVTPYSIMILKEDLKSTNEIYCILQGIMFEISYTTTLFILTYISLDRLLALYLPLKYKKLMRARTVFWINIGTWIVPVIRPIVRYLIRVFSAKKACKDHYYGYNNDDYFMVCYNTDYIAFVKGEVGNVNMIDLCIVVVACQLATLVSSVLVVTRLSQRLHIKRSTISAKSSRRKSVTTEIGADTSTSSFMKHSHPPEDKRGDTQVEKDEDFSEMESEPAQKIKSKKQEKEQHAIVTMVMVIVFFMVTYTPSFICFIVPGIYTMAKNNNHLWIFLVVDYCTFINSTFLPMVHFSRSSGFKRQLKSIKAKILRCMGVSSPRKTFSASINKPRGTSVKPFCRTEFNESMAIKSSEETDTTLTTKTLPCQVVAPATRASNENEFKDNGCNARVVQPNGSVRATYANSNVIVGVPERV